MTTVNISRYTGQTYYRSPPTNPKAGIKSGNTVVWNGRTGEAVLIIPRQNPVDIASWSPQSSSWLQSVARTNEKPPYYHPGTDSYGRSAIYTTKTSKPLKTQLDTSRYLPAANATNRPATLPFPAKQGTIPDSVFKKYA